MRSAHEDDLTQNVAKPTDTKFCQPFTNKQTNTMHTYSLRAELYTFHLCVIDTGTTIRCMLFTIGGEEEGKMYKTWIKFLGTN